jgi:PilZ domain
MSGEPRIELHGAACSCRGGAWVLLEATQKSPCGNGHGADERLVLGLAEWRQLGKPGSLAVFQEAQRRVDAGERRQFQRFEVTMPVQIARIATWRDPSAQTEDTLAEVIAAGGALVRSRMAVEKGEMVRFAVGEAYDTRAEVMYVSLGSGTGMDGVQRLGLRFLDAPLPETLIPTDARPLE